MIHDTLQAMRLLRVALCVLPFLLLCFRSRRLDLPWKYRSDQYLCVPLAVLYCIPAMLRVDSIAAGLVSLVHKFSLFFSFVPVLGKLLALLDQTLGLSYGVQLLANTVIMLGFCAAKHLAIRPCQKLRGRFPGIYQALLKWFYEKKDGESFYYLQEHCLQLRDLMRTMYLCVVGLGVLDMAVCAMDPQTALNRYPIYPVFGIIVMGECVAFLGGMTRTETNHELTGEEHEQKDPEFEKLYQDLEDLLADRLLQDGQTEKMPLPSHAEDEDDPLTELCMGSNVEQLIGNYFRHKRICGYPVEMDGVQACVKLMTEQSVLFCNPFYRDLGDYLMVPVLHHLLNNRRVLVISGRGAGNQDVLDWLRESLSEASSLENLWNAAFLKRGEQLGPDKLPDIGILSFNDLYDLDLQQQYQPFFAAVDMVIVLEPSNFMGTGQIGLRSVCQQCERPGKKITYAICDRNCDGLVDALSHALREPITEVMASPLPRVPYYSMFWAAEGPGVAARILPKVSHYMGFGTELGAVSLNHGIEDVYWYAGSRMPLRDLRWAVEQYTKPLCGYIGCTAEQSELDRHFHFVDGLWQAGYMENAVVIVEDEFYNLFEMTRNFAARTKGTGFINVLCGSYLLRDYMCGNRELFENDPKAVPSFCPDFARTEHNLTLRLLLLMAAAPQEETMLRHELDLAGIEEHDVFRAVQTLIEKHTDLPPDIVQACYRSEQDPFGPGRIARKYLSVSRRDFIRLYNEILRPAFFVVENEQMNACFMGARVMGQVCQTLLPGQFFCYDGRHYQVQSITPENGIIVRRAADHLNGRHTYRQLRRYTLQNLTSGGESRDLRGLTLCRMNADITVTTDSYYTMESRSDFGTAHLVRMEGGIPERRYRAKNLLRVTLPDANPDELYTLCALLNELFVTLFPGEEGFLVAATNAKQPADDVQRAIVPQLTVDDAPALYVIEDCFMDLGAVVSVDRSFQRIMEILTDYLDWYLDPARERRDPETSKAAAHAVMADTVGDGVQTVEGEDEEVVSGLSGVGGELKLREYLTYGGETDAEFLALPEVLAYLQRCRFDESALHRTRKGNPEMEEYQRHIEAGDHLCDFCGCVMEPGKFTVLKDGRERCPECSKTAVRHLRDARRIYFDTRDEMEKTFGISLRTALEVHFVNAKKLARDGNQTFTPTKGFDPRAIGFASDDRRGKRKLYLENGAPKEALEATIVHELTHIWQYENWNDTVPHTQENLPVYEGMAVWAEIQYMRGHGMEARANRYEYNRMREDSEYGEGLRRYAAKYRFAEGRRVNRSRTPFGHIPPL